MKIALIIIGAVVGIIYAASILGKTPERREAWRKVPTTGCLILLLCGVFCGLMGWLIYWILN